MTLSVAKIAKMAFDGVSKGLSGVVQSASFTRHAHGSYDPATGTYADTPTTITGRALVASETAVADVFPDFMAGPADVVVYLEGFASGPLENDTLTVGVVSMLVLRSRDIMATGGFFVVVARRSA